MKKLIPIIIILLVFSVCASAQNHDDKSKKILSDLSSKIKGYESLKMEFTYKMENKKDNIDESLKGTVIIKKDKYSIDFSEQLILCDGHTVWTYLKDANEVQISLYEESDETITPQNVFTIYEKGHRSKYIREGTENGKRMHVIELVPIESKQYYKVRININIATGMLYSSVVFDRSGSTFTYTLDKISTNIPIDEDYFSFNKSNYPKVEVIDLR